MILDITVHDTDAFGLWQGDMVEEIDLGEHAVGLFNRAVQEQGEPSAMAEGGSACSTRIDY